MNEKELIKGKKNRNKEERREIIMMSDGGEKKSKYVNDTMDEGERKRKQMKQVTQVIEKVKG